MMKNLLYNIWEKTVPIKVRDFLNLRRRLNMVDPKTAQRQEELLKFYRNSQDPEIRECLEYITKNKSLGCFNYPFVEEYVNVNIKIKYDSKKDLRFYILNGKRMYLSRKLKQPDMYVKSLLIEQDMRSPHCYLANEQIIRSGSVIFDVGGAEANFTLMQIDNISKAVIFECDAYWLEALEATFEDYKDKVEIVPGKIGRENNDNIMTIDHYIEKTGIMPDYIKMDIEGAEIDALHGAARTLSQSSDLTLFICVYHRKEDENDIRKLLEDKFTIKTSPGYMISGTWEEPYFRRGVLQAKRRSCITEE